jgi:hypothetical protein
MTDVVSGRRHDGSDGALEVQRLWEDFGVALLAGQRI